MTKQSQLSFMPRPGVHSIVLIGYRQPLLRQPAKGARKIHWSSCSPNSNKPSSQVGHGQDPKLLVRVHEHGYTGPSGKHFDHRPRPTEPNTSNPAPKSVWGRPLFDWTRQYSKSIAPLPACPSNIKLQPKHPNLDTFLHSDVFSDSIESRKSMIKEDPPRWRGTELLPPIQLEIGISAKGTVEAVRWTGHSRNESLFSTFHQEVIQFIKRLQFTPLKQVEFDKDPLWTWGTIDFIWGHPEAPGISAEEIQPALSPQP